MCFQHGREAPCWWDLHQRCELLPQGPGNQRLCRQAQVRTSQKRVGCPSFLPLLLLQYQKPACIWFHHDERDRAILSQRANHLLPVPPSFLSLLYFLDIPCGCAKINHLNFSHCVDWYVPTPSDDCARWLFVTKTCRQAMIQSENDHSDAIIYQKNDAVISADFLTGAALLVKWWVQTARHVMCLCTHSDLKHTGGLKHSAGGM